ncbi:hypothetical protein KALB_7009 [Kutzneria albida DSM 43870]|uniref:Uncharacterized protein n=2 Tax=Kutzneria TaxID=43356 RepID=W5WIE6_9PSEU|nr:hypothetical protein KALB_7009 [Kutzneria albida DSM 43870]
MMAVLPGIAGEYGQRMAPQASGPVLGPTLAEWLKAREETRSHLSVAGPPVDESWVQRLSDLLATERSWQEQYTELLALGRPGGRFPPSQR